MELVDRFVEQDSCHERQSHEEVLQSHDKVDVTGARGQQFDGEVEHLVVWRVVCRRLFLADVDLEACVTGEVLDVSTQ